MIAGSPSVSLGEGLFAAWGIVEEAIAVLGGPVAPGLAEPDVGVDLVVGPALRRVDHEALLLPQDAVVGLHRKATVVQGEEVPTFVLVGMLYEGGVEDFSVGVAPVEREQV